MVAKAHAGDFDRPFQGVFGSAKLNNEHDKGVPGGAFGELGDVNGDFFGVAGCICGGTGV